MKNTGFTLAEVLITLGIIGIVAALTIPALITNTQDKQFRAAYKKSISDISQAMKLVYNDTEETYTSIDWVQMPVYFCKLQRYMKVQTSGIKCDEVTEDIKYGNSGEWPKNSRTTYWDYQHNWYNKQKEKQDLNTGYIPLTYTLMNGSMVNFNCYKQVFVDVNGIKGPNTIGRDIYFMYFTDGATSPYTGFANNKTTIIPNSCTKNGTNSTPHLTKDNYVNDCIHGSGWGCSFML